MIKNILYSFGFVSVLTLSCSDYQGSASLNSPSVQCNLPQQKATQKTTKPDEGKAIFLKYCMSCHQKDGSGVPGMYPPLQKSDWVNGDKKRIINVVINGLEGVVNVNDEEYSQVMPKQNYLTNKQIAQVLSYLRMNMGNHSDSVKVKEVTAIRKVFK